MNIRILYFDGCPNTEDTSVLLQGILDEFQIDSAIEMVRVTEESAGAERFLGSPSIQIDGVDIERHRRNDSPVFGCRVYRIGGRLRSLPDRGMIVEAIEEALRISGGVNG